MPEVDSGGQGRETGLARHDHLQKLSVHEQEKLQAALELLTRLVEE
jgi:hypothetical protein